MTAVLTGCYHPGSLRRYKNDKTNQTVAIQAQGTVAFRPTETPTPAPWPSSFGSQSDGSTPMVELNVGGVEAGFVDSTIQVRFPPRPFSRPKSSPRSCDRVEHPLVFISSFLMQEGPFMSVRVATKVESKTFIRLLQCVKPIRPHCKPFS